MPLCCLVVSDSTVLKCRGYFISLTQWHLIIISLNSVTTTYQVWFEEFHKISVLPVCAMVVNHFFRKRCITLLTNSALEIQAGSWKMNTALEYSTRVVQEGGRRCKKSTLNDLVHLTPLKIPLMNPPYESKCGGREGVAGFQPMRTVSVRSSKQSWKVGRVGKVGKEGSLRE